MDGDECGVEVRGDAIPPSIFLRYPPVAGVIYCFHMETIAFSMDCCDREIMSYVATTGEIQEAVHTSLHPPFGKNNILYFRSKSSIFSRLTFY
jgi:hypothetical protein